MASMQQPWHLLSNEFVNDDWIYQQISHSQQEFNVVQCIKDLTNYVWKVYASSPIFNYELNEDSMKKLAENLKCALSSEGIICSDCTVKSVPLLAYAENDDMALQVSVTMNADKSYEALFISRGTQNKKNKHCVNLPVLLCRGSLKLISTVNKCLGKLFDCTLTPVTFSVKELIAILLIVVKNGGYFKDDSHAEPNVELKFKCLEYTEASIAYSIKLENLKDLWDSICTSIDTITTSEIIILFYKEILTHFRKIYGIDLSCLSLKTFKVKNCIVNSKGVIKCKVPEMYDFLLKHLTNRVNYEKRI